MSDWDWDLKKVVIIGFLKPGNYLPSNIAYFSMHEVTPSDLTRTINDLIVRDGYGVVIVAEAPETWGRATTKVGPA